MLKKGLILFTMGLLLCSCRSVPEGELSKTFTAHRVFGSHMVLQGSRPIVFSGTAEPGRIVLVSFAGKNLRAQANEQGEWSVTYPAMEPGKTGYILKVSGDPTVMPLVFNDILIGEVWLCAGEGNMEMPVWNKNPFWCISDSESEVVQAKYPMIRFWQGAQRTSPFEAQAEPSGSGWQVCSPLTIRPFSAVAYCFGRALQNELQIPVGLIHVSCSETGISSWLSPDTIERNAIQPETMQRSAGREAQINGAAALRRIQREYESKQAEWRKSFFDEESFAVKAAADWVKPDFDDSRWPAMSANGTMPGDEHGIAVFRATLTLPEECAGKDLVLDLGPIDDIDETFFNGECVGSITDLNHPKDYWRFPRSYTVPGKLVKAGKNVLAVRVADFGGSGGFMNVKNIAFRQDGKVLNLAVSWKAAMVLERDEAFVAKRPIEPKIEIHSNQFPGTLYNGMVAPWTRLAIRGVIWYQGCSNAGEMRYYQLQKLLIDDWRAQFREAGMPFVLVQLAGFEAYQPENPLPEDAWMRRAIQDQPRCAVTREIQAEMLKDSHVGMAVAMDVGEQSNIYPQNKQIVGSRLCAEAMRVAYGKDAVSQGPRFRSFKVEGDSVRVFFDNVGKGLTTSDGKVPGAFALKDAKGQLCWADAVIDGDTVVVHSPMVEHPVAVRYAFCDYRGDVNLMNKDGFAAVPFRSDAQKYPLGPRYLLVK